MIERRWRTVPAPVCLLFAIAVMFPSTARSQTTPTTGTQTPPAKTTTPPPSTTTPTPPKSAETAPPPKREAAGPHSQGQGGGDAKQPGHAGDHRTQEKRNESPKEQPKAPKKKSGCCACVTKLELEYLGPRHDRTREKVVNDPLGENDPKVKPGTPVYGDEFKLKIYYRNKPLEDGDDNGELSLEWLETTSRPLYGPSFPVGAATDVLEWLRLNKPEGLEGPTFHPWTHRKADCPAPPKGSLLMPHIEIDDLPRTVIGAGRTLEFKFVVRSAPNCRLDPESKPPCKAVLELTAKQVLEDDGKNGKSTFYGPSGAPMRVGQVVSVP